MTTRALRFEIIAAVAFLTFGLREAHAQLGPPGGAGGIGGIGGGHAPTKSQDSDEPKPQGPPPAIPGAVASPESVVPANKLAKDLDPNAALFDAIDRGDLTAARDALSRGADLNAHNVLGQTPLDMSIDLSRNPITFLLLSMRSQDSDPNAATPLNGSEQASAAPPPAVHRRRHPRTVEVAAAQPAKEASGNVPQPSAGFLGFGSH